MGEFAVWVGFVVGVAVLGLLTLLWAEITSPDACDRRAARRQRRRDERAHREHLRRVRAARRRYRLAGHDPADLVVHRDVPGDLS